MNPEFQMKGVSFVVSTLGGGRGHARPFRVNTRGRTIEVQGALQENFTVEDVALCLMTLAQDLLTATSQPAVLSEGGADPVAELPQP